MKYRAKCDSLGFMGRRWYEGEVTDDINDPELLKDPALECHFEAIDGEDSAPGQDPEKELTMKQLAIQQSLGEFTVPQLRQYAAEHGIDVPARATKAEIMELLEQ